MESATTIRLMYVVHQSYGRLRMRLGRLRDDPSEAEAIADGLNALSGVELVEVRPFTGSVLCLYDPSSIGAARIVEELRGLSHATHVVGPGEERPAEVERELVRASLLSGSQVARAATRAVEELDLEVLRATGGSVNLGTLTSLAFLALGATEIITSGKLPLPPWFNLGWWSFRTFTISERKVIGSVERDFDQRVTEAEANVNPPGG